MEDLALPVVLAIVVQGDRIVLVRREKEPYLGLLGLPGGKIEKGETVPEAAIREVKEETGLETRFNGYLGLGSEFLVQEEKVLRHFLLHLCQLEALSSDLQRSEEGAPEWYKLNELDQFKKEIIPSDFLKIKEVFLNQKRGYYDCLIENKNGDYVLKKFEPISLMNGEKKEEFKLGCGALIINDNNQVLLIKRGSKAKSERGVWSRPGGGVEEGESPEEAVKREIKEELGIEIEILEPLDFIEHLSDTGQHWIALGYLAKVKNGEPRIMEPEKIEEIKWFSLDEIPENLAIYTQEGIRKLKEKLGKKRNP
jgi:mutator protein MutT